MDQHVSTLPLKNAVPAEVYPNLVITLVSYLLYVTGQVPILIDPALEIAEQVPPNDRATGRQMRQLHSSLRFCRGRIAETVDRLLPVLQASRLYVTVALLFGPSIASPRRVFLLQVPIYSYTSPLMAGNKPVEAGDYMRMLSREILRLQLSMDLQPYRCYPLLCEDVTSVAISPPAVIELGLATLASNLNKYERRALGSNKKTVSSHVIRFLMNEDTNHQQTLEVSEASLAKLRLLGSIRGFATFVNESDNEDADVM
ncbi:Hypothetical protein GSB_150233 [Giardia duodenalis]|uniref:Uncharacterized protein n=2 Tax=Giardia intestinalis TaxID=5741 RepID=C6LXS4_GIAIB|nr:Hypothetical protein GL50581_3590 [Giardia intestinalis ATCC 50581]ESU45822.1 Hypothetical protein GSB_150233 [Giardia intestinalis]